MVKVNEKENSLVSEAQDQLENLLREKTKLEVISDIDFEQPWASLPPSPGHTFGLQLKDRNEEIKLVVLVTKSLQPRQVDGIIFRLQREFPYEGVYHLLIAPNLSEKVRGRLEAEKVGWLDFGGNTHLELGTHLIHIEGRPIPKKHRERRPQLSLYTSKASRILRILLQGPLRSWKVEELAKAAEVSLGLVSKVRQLLLDLQAAEEDQDGIRITEADELLLEWVRTDDWEKRTETREYSLLESDPEKIASEVEALIAGKKHAFTRWYGAFLRQPYTLPAVTTLYVEDFPDEDVLKKALGARRVNGGGGLALVKPKDAGVFLGLQKIRGRNVVCDVQLYLDVIHAGRRGDDAAEELRKAENFSGGWK